MLRPNKKLLNCANARSYCFDKKKDERIKDKDKREKLLSNKKICHFYYSDRSSGNDSAKSITLLLYKREGITFLKVTIQYSQKLSYLFIFIFHWDGPATKLGLA